MQKSEEPILFRRANNFVIGMICAAAAGAGCSTGRPSVDYVIAREAFMAAKEVEAAKYAPGYFHKAEESYREAVTKYDQQQFRDAINDFRAARIFAEKAENAARIQRQKAGDEAL